MRQITASKRQDLYNAIRAVMTEATRKNGRDDELDLFGQPGRYVRAMDKRIVGKPCPRCGTTIEKINFLGGSCYVCPQCQPVE